MSCLEGAGTILPQCVEDKTTLAQCMTEAQNCASNGAMPGPGCTAVGLTGCCVTPSTGAEVCFYDHDVQSDQQTCAQNGGVWSTMP